jgi:hypothetical protein
MDEQLPSLPTEEELDNGISRASDALEDVQEIARHVFAVINEQGEQQVTFAEIGALYIYLREIRSRIESTEAELAKIETAMTDLDGIRMEGKNPYRPSFDEAGIDNYTPARLARLADELVSAAG